MCSLQFNEALIDSNEEKINNEATDTTNDAPAASTVTAGRKRTPRRVMFNYNSSLAPAAVISPGMQQNGKGSNDEADDRDAEFVNRGTSGITATNDLYGTELNGNDPF